MATPEFSSISCLLNFTNEELIDAGESGIIVGRLLTIDAYDAALRLRPGSPIYHSWVPVLDFLKALLTDDVYNKIIDINIKYRDALYAFQVYINDVEGQNQDGLPSHLSRLLGDCFYLQVPVAMDMSFL